MNFFEFERAVLRLKEATRVQTDKELALLLGMELSAFNKRKGRGSFPVERLEVLARERPELGIDVQHVLTGVSQGARAAKFAAVADQAIAELVREARDAGHLPAAWRPDYVLEGENGALAVVELKEARELTLLSQYRSADQSGRRAIEATAAAVSNYGPRAAPAPPAGNESTGVRQRFHAAVGQVAARDIVNKGTKVDVGASRSKRK